MYTHIKSVQILISLLKQYDIRHIVLSPGTRNTAFAHSVETDDFFTCYSIVDERSAGYFAIGISEAIDRPVCVSCTAATAACNYMPAMQEAWERGIQLVALTADQNPYEMFHMEDQCIDQVDMFHGYVKCAVDVPKVLNSNDEWYCNRRINEALLALNHHGKGPVQINYHMSYSTQELSTFEVEKLPVTRKIERIDGGVQYKEFAELIEKKKRVLVVGGSFSDINGQLTRAITEFGKKYNCVIVADTYANIHDKQGVFFNPMALGDVITPSQIQMLEPDLIISFGAVYYSTIKYFMPSYASKVEHWQIAEDGMINDGYKALTKVFECKPEEFFEGVTKNQNSKNDKEYYALWKKRMDLMHFQNLPFTYLSAVIEFCKMIPAHALFHTTVLDSIRMSNYAKMDDTVRCYANIGADGIDGALSAFLGQARSEKDLSFLLIGDLSLMYDMNALLQDIPNNVRIMVVNNYAGAEFHKNFGLERIPTLNKHIAAGHSVKIVNCCGVSGFDYLVANDMDSLEQQLRRFIEPNNKPMLLEVFTDAALDAKMLKEYWSINRQEIPGAKIGWKARIKQVARNVLKNQTLHKMLRR